MSSTSTDALEGANFSVAYKAPVRSAITANCALSGFTAVTTIDGSLTPADGERWLLTAQTAGAENLIYLSRSGAWELAPDTDGTRDLRKGTKIATQSGIVYRLTTADDIAPGTTSCTWQIDSLGTSPPKLTTAQRDALTPAAGWLIYNTTTSKFQGYTSSWVDLH